MYETKGGFDLSFTSNVLHHPPNISRQKTGTKKGRQKNPLAARLTVVADGNLPTRSPVALRPTVSRGLL